MLQTPASPKPCIHCGKEFVPKYTAMQIACSLRCAASYVKKQKGEKEKNERRRDKARKEALKSLSELTEECRVIVQKMARIRDRHDGCISCHLPATWDGQWHGSHYRPAGNHAAVELHLWNIHKSCSACNRHKGGNIAGYTPRLIAKIGQDRVDWLNAQNQPVKRTREYLARFKKVMGKRLRRMEKRI
jgi:hypothetical protein